LRCGNARKLLYGFHHAARRRAHAGDRPRLPGAGAVYEAIRAGYRALDCACDYGSEAQVGEGIKRAIDEGIVARKDLFVTSKIWMTYHAADKVEPALQRSLSDCSSSTSTVADPLPDLAQVRALRDALPA